MSVTITPLRLALLVGCLAAFSLMGGFSPLDADIDVQRVSAKAQKAWFYCIVAFVVGAIGVSVIDHQVGHVDPTNLRFAYIIGGIALMTLGVLWNRSLRSGLAELGDAGVSVSGFEYLIPLGALLTG